MGSLDTVISTNEPTTTAAASTTTANSRASVGLFYARREDRRKVCMSFMVSLELHFSVLNLYHYVRRWSKMEAAVRRQLDDQLLHYENLVLRMVRWLLRYQSYHSFLSIHLLVLYAT